jgi:hypothetical protein
MADAKTTGTETEEELIPVETPPEELEEQQNGADEGDEEDEEDERLAGSEEESEEDISTSTNRERRKKRREQHKRAREAKEREIELLRQQTLQLQQRLAAVEGHTQSATVSNLEAQIARTQSEIQQAERIIAKATEAGNGDDVVTAMRIRDAAIADYNKLSGVRQQFDRQRQQAAQPQVDPAVVGFAKQWLAANPWYDPNGGDSDSALTKSIDAQILREGFNPTSREYWEELTSRVADALGEDGETPQTKPKRRAPPTGNTREHAPMSTKREIYVTPERKQAMIEAGVWDDPVKRQRMLKAYQSYDSGSAR